MRAMSARKTTKRRSYSYRTVRRRPTAATRAKREARKRTKLFRLWRRRFLIAVFLVVALPIAARLLIHFSVKDRVYPEVHSVPRCRVALVLGAAVRSDGTLSQSLESRVDKAVQLWREGKCEKLLMSGDNRVVEYNEPQRMRTYAMQRGVPKEAIAMDFAGRRTYDSIYRAKHIFDLEEIIVVTQRFHADRAVFLCDRLGIKACGVQADSGDIKAAVREIPACLLAILDAYILHPRPVMGDKETI